MNYIKLITIVFLFYSCSPKNLETVSGPSLTNVFVETQVFILKDGNYQQLETDKFPEPRQGKKQFMDDMLSDFQYPHSAREKGIQGTVMFELLIDEEGEVVKRSQVSSLHPECDKEARKAIERGTRLGFYPYEHMGKAIALKYRLPVRFMNE